MGASSDVDRASFTSASESTALRNPSKLHAEDIYEWLVRRRVDDIPQERVLTAIRTAAGVVPLAGQALASGASTALISAHEAVISTSNKPEDVFFDVLLTCVNLPATLPREKQRQAIESYLTQELAVPLVVPSSADDSEAWWHAQLRARTAYFSARRAFFLVRIELLRIAAFQSHARGLGGDHHPQASLVQEIVTQLTNDGLVDALLEELCGRERVSVPTFYAHLRSPLPLASSADTSAERQLRAAQHHWERQLLDEEELIRELLLLALHVANERLPLRRITQVMELVLKWPAVVLPDVFSEYTLALPAIQRQLARVSSIGSMLLMQLVERTTSTQVRDEWRVATAWTEEFVLSEVWREVDVDDHQRELVDLLTESGIALVAWATLLAKVYRCVSADGSLSEEEDSLQMTGNHLQRVLQASEQARGFQQMSDVLRRLTVDAAASSPLPADSDDVLPGPRKPPSLAPMDDEVDSAQDVTVAVFQVVGALFLDDALSALGYVDHLDDPVQLHAMAKLITPVLTNPSVANAILHDKAIDSSGSRPEYGSALAVLVTESRASWPDDLVPGLRVLSALCGATKATVSSSSFAASLPPRAPLVSLLHHGRAFPAVQLSLKELSKSRMIHTTASSSACRPLPPDEYLEFASQEGDEANVVVCRRTFAYTDGDRLAVPAGTQGFIDQDDQGRTVVQWQLTTTESRTAWESLLISLETLVDQIQSQPLVAIESNELDTMTAFLEWIIQASSSGANSVASTVVTQVLQQWAYARLKQWWRDNMGLEAMNTMADIPSLLFQSKVSVAVLQSASREDLVAWGVYDRFTREQILSKITSPDGASSVAAHQQRRAASHEELERDGLTHLLRMLLGFLDGFVHDRAQDFENDDMGATSDLTWTPKQLQFIAAVLGVLATFTGSLDLCIDLWIHDIGGSSQECVDLVVKSTRKLFDYYESGTGIYPGLFATLATLRHLSRWCIAHEAIAATATPPASSVHFREAERHWLVATVEFVIEMVATHETWQFTVVTDKWLLLNQCFTLLTALLSARYHSGSSGDGGMLLDFQAALRHTILTDAPLIMKILRSCGRLLAHNEADGRRSAADNKKENTALYPLAVEREVGQSATGLQAREALVVAALRLLDVVLDDHSSVSPSSGASAVSHKPLLLQPIDGDGFHQQDDEDDRDASLNLVTLCAGYLAYPLTKSPRVVHASLKMIQRAAQLLVSSSSSDHRDDFAMGKSEISEPRSLVTLFRDRNDLDFVRDTLLSLVRTPPKTPDTMALRKELLDFLTTCLDTQPGFFALLVLDEESDEQPKSGGKSTKKLVGLLEKLLESSDKLLDANTDVLCSLLKFVRHVWRGAVKERRKLHLQIAHALRYSSKFWQNLTLVLRVQLPVSMDPERDELGMEVDQLHGGAAEKEDDDVDAVVAALGRSGVYGSIARGLILEIVSCEWHAHCSSSSSAGEQDHPLVSVLESFREEGLYAQWLRTFTRLEYSSSRFAQVAGCVHAYVPPFPRGLLSTAATEETGEKDGKQGESVLQYQEGVVQALRVLRWQFEPLAKTSSGRVHDGDAETLQATYRHAQWSARTAAHTAAQLYALAQWQIFMELYSLQLSNQSTTTDGDEDQQQPATSGFRETRKRKESMLASPVRSSGGGSHRPSASSSLTPVSPLPHHAPSSLFSGDRTSYGMIQVLSDVISFQCERHEREVDASSFSGQGAAGSSGSKMDLFTLCHLKHVTELLVSMLHHQIRIVVCKTRDPKLSATRPRESSRPLRLTVAKSIELLALVERAANHVFASGTNHRHQQSELASTSSVWNKQEQRRVPLWEQLLGGESFHSELQTPRNDLRCSLLTAALLLTRHIATQQNANGASVAHELQQRAVVVQVKWIHHAIESIKLCDGHDHHHESEDPEARLFQLSWSLLHAMLDDFTVVTAAHEKQKLKLDAIISLAPLIALLQHETSGLRALFEIVLDKFPGKPAATAPSRVQQKQACAVLKGLNAIVWNPRNAELIRHVMLSDDPVRGFSVLRFLAKKLVPGLRECLGQEQSTIRGYQSPAKLLHQHQHQPQQHDHGSTTSKSSSLERSNAHQAWCSVLMIAAGLVRQLPGSSPSSSINSSNHHHGCVWEFLAAAEPLLAEALSSSKSRLNRAVVDEQACALTFLNALSSCHARRKQWREMLPRNCLVLMEQSRLVLRRACVLVGNSSYSAIHKREQQHHAQLLKKPRRLSVTAWPLSSSPRALSLLAMASSASQTFAHQTLLHEHLEPVAAHEKHHLPAFYSEMETKLIHVVEQGAHLLLKWTASLTARASTVVVDSVRLIDDEQLIPLLAWTMPSESLTMSCEPSIGHLCVAMEYCVDQFKKSGNGDDNAAINQLKKVAANALQTCALLFLKTYLIHVDQQQSAADAHGRGIDDEQHKDLVEFFQQLLEELKEVQVADGGEPRVDMAFFQQILKVVQVKPN